ncbi:hypothetical protein [Prosthecobacter sp.]|jgi:hypothetical protein|uniref:hypothetical protein n=1 Tax=Prosthecobacter sp. TaxID=1965333 RepID=UPI0037C81795
MKYHFFPPSTGLLFSSLAMLSLSVMGNEPEMPAGGARDADSMAKNERDPEGDVQTPLEQAQKPGD